MNNVIRAGLIVMFAVSISGCGLSGIAFRDTNPVFKIMLETLLLTCLGQT